jgi:hypothetical protein
MKLQHDLRLVDMGRAGRFDSVRHIDVYWALAAAGLDPVFSFYRTPRETVFIAATCKPIEDMLPLYGALRAVAGKITAPHDFYAGRKTLQHIRIEGHGRYEDAVERMPAHFFSITGRFDIRTRDIRTLQLGDPYMRLSYRQAVHSPAMAMSEAKIEFTVPAPQAAAYFLERTTGLQPKGGFMPFVRSLLAANSSRPRP